MNNGLCPCSSLALGGIPDTVASMVLSWQGVVRAIVTVWKTQIVATRPSADISLFKSEQAVYRMTAVVNPREVTLQGTDSSYEAGTTVGPVSPKQP